MKNISLDLSHSMIPVSDLEVYYNQIKEIVSNLQKNTMAGWLHYPNMEQKQEIEQIKKIASKIREQSDYLICIGIGGSYLGAKAIIDALTPRFEKTKILYAGNNLDNDYLYELIEFVKDKDFSINVISKSGTTLEPSLAFRLFKKILDDKYQDEAYKRIIITTDSEKGVLKKIAAKEKYETLIIPDNIGGRYSALTPVGLLPMAVAGIDIDKLLLGYENGKNNYSNGFNIAYQYASVRHVLKRQNKMIELLAIYNCKLTTFSEWWKQLFGESEGKDLKGLFPASVTFTTDLHSLGQYIQEGKRILFETIVNIETPNYSVMVPRTQDNSDGLNYLEGISVDYINKQAMKGVVKAHTDGNVPNIIINLKKLDEENLGELIYFFFLSCAIACSLDNINPFNQPGVEKYKNNMFELLGKNK